MKDQFIYFKKTVCINVNLIILLKIEFVFYVVKLFPFVINVKVEFNVCIACLDFI